MSTIWQTELVAGQNLLGTKKTIALVDLGFAMTVVSNLTFVRSNLSSSNARTHIFQHSIAAQHSIPTAQHQPGRRNIGQRLIRITKYQADSTSCIFQ